MITFLFSFSLFILLPHAIVFMGASGWYTSQAAFCRAALETTPEDPMFLSKVVSVVIKSDQGKPWFVLYVDWLFRQSKRIRWSKVKK